MLRRPWSWFFLVVLVLVSVNWAGANDPVVELDGGLWGRFVPIAGVLLGIAWQVVDRRDLADRLVIPAVGLGCMLTLHLLAGGVYTRVTALLSGLGIAVGLVAAEQWLRRSGRSGAATERNNSSLTYTAR